MILLKFKVKKVLREVLLIQDELIKERGINFLKSVSEKIDNVLKNYEKYLDRAKNTVSRSR